MSFGVIASAIVFNKRVAISYVDEVIAKSLVCVIITHFAT